MKQNFSFIYRTLLVIGDTLALVISFSYAYILRVSLDPRPLANSVNARSYILLIIALLPLLIGIFYILGLYAKRTYEHRPKEALKLLAGSVFGVLIFIAYDFFSQDVLFPAKLIPLYATLISFTTLWVGRTMLRWLRLSMYRRHYGVSRIVLVGSSETTYYLSKYLYDNTSSGFDVVGIVASKRNIYEESLGLQYRSLQQAVEATNPHAIIQTDSADVVRAYNTAIEHHLDYQFIPSHSALFTSKHSVELLGAFPIINVHTTPLIGYGRAVKRMIDIAGGLLIILLTLPATLFIMLVMKITDLQNPVFFKQRRLSRFNKAIHIFKFRTLKSTYNGITPEEAFTKMGKPELIKEYRENADHLEDDPRVTRIGRFLRRTKLDEIPQIINVIRGDISLVGPRALVPYELENYEFKSLILSVKSGLTGLAQISGRDDISFEERRKLDMYYVQNWSIWMDIQILVRTIFTVLSGRGTR